MQLDITNDSLLAYEALASKVRLQIIQLLSKSKMNIKELATELKLSSAIVTMHVKKLENANIVKTERLGNKKIVSLKVDKIEVNFPKKIFQAFDTIETSIPIGHYTNYQIEPTCGLATLTDFIGDVDYPKYFMDPRRMDAQLLWFGKGFLEYQTPNYLEGDHHLEMVEISLEISSEFPFANDNWPSDITFSLNNIELGTWTSPGDFADVRGKLTPSWYPDNQNQYGLLKTIRVYPHGTYMEGDLISSVKLSDIPIDVDRWTLRIEVKDDAQHIAGCSIFGKGFGNYPQDIVMKLFYS